MGGRIGVNNDDPNHRGDRGLGRSAGGFYGEGTALGKRDEDKIAEYHQHQGRWPSNFCLIHQPPQVCPDCNGTGVIWKPDGTWISLCPNCETEDGPGVWGFGKVDKCPDCGSDIVAQEEQVMPSPCPTCGGSGELQGCRRAGMKRVRGIAPRGKPSNGQSVEASGYTPPVHVNTDYADPDGLETVAAYDCAEGCPVARLDEQAGEREVSGTAKLGKDNRAGAAMFGSCEPGYKSKMPNDTGGASRFYFQADWQYEVAEQLAASDPVHYCPKAAKRERNEGLDDFYWRKDKDSPTGFTRITKDEWEALGEEEKRIKAKTGKRVSLRAQGNIHPTQKPIALNEWLATLLLPPKEYAPRRIAIPFFGMGSEGIGAMLAGWDEIVAIEMIRDYCDAGEARMDFWASQSHQLELGL